MAFVIFGLVIAEVAFVGQQTTFIALGFGALAFIMAKADYFESTEYELRLALLSYLHTFDAHLNERATRSSDQELRRQLLDLRSMSALLEPKDGDANDKQALTQLIENLNSIGNTFDDISSGLKDGMSSALMGFIALTSVNCISRAMGDRSKLC